MGDLIKSISMFSEDAINMAISQFIDVETSDSFISTLQTLQSVLKKPAKKRKKETTVFKMSDKNIFEQRVLPQIREKLAEYKRLEELGKKPVWKINVDFVGDYKKFNVKDLKLYHAIIMEEEKTIASLDLVIKFYRGLIYFRARELYPNLSMNTFFPKEFGICYDVAKRYMIFSSIIKRYPRLMFCGLSYTQIMKHQKRLFDSIKADLNLHDDLSEAFSVTVENKVVEIQASDMCVPMKTFNVNPDFVYDNFINDNDSDKPEDKKFEDWLNQMSESNEIFNKTGTLGLEKDLADKAKIN